MSRGKTSRKRWWVALAAGMLLAGLALHFATSDNPDELFRQARAVAEMNPGAAEELLFRGIAAAGGDFPEAQFCLCRLLARQGRWIEARGGFSLIRDTRSLDPGELGELAETALAADELTLTDLIRQSLERDQRDASQAALLRLQIVWSLKWRQQRDTIQRAEELIELSPDDAFPWQVLGGVYQDRKEVAKAIDAYRHALERKLGDEQELDTRQQLLEALLQMEDAAGARREWDQIAARQTAANVGDASSLGLKQARLLRLERRFPEALELTDRLLAAEPRSVAARMLRGVLLFDVREFEKAVVDLEQVVAAQPASKEAHYKLALAYRELSRFPDAEKHLEISSRLNQLSQQILSLETRVEQEPENVELLRTLADLYRQVGRLDRAQQLFRLVEMAQAGKPP